MDYYVTWRSLDSRFRARPLSRAAEKSLDGDAPKAWGNSNLKETRYSSSSRNYISCREKIECLNLTR